MIPQGPRMVEEIMLNETDGLERFEKWRHINELAPSIEVTGEAGDFVLMHHMMPHGASRNKQATPRIAQFTRYYRVSETEAREANGLGTPLAPGAEEGLTPLARKGERGFAYRIRCLAVQSNSQTVLPANRFQDNEPNGVKKAQGLRHGIKLVTVLRD